MKILNIFSSLLLTCSISYAQSSTNLFEWVDTAQLTVSLTSKEISFVDTIYTVPSVSDIDFIKINNLIALQDSGKLSFTFPIGGETDTIMAYALDVQYESDSNYIWKGEIPSHNG